ncbi:terminase family protein [Sphingomonas sp. HITSZ_GF]|uniref:DNA-packaging protein n=1 Tax=Sphingomonas sp. HITSZ_GF TaxID=3037247 RepID=UPI00240D27E6|nr:terminase family protein [Sphingomonas sp. HITSZ_GF]MDG2534492.1 terminase family protein [Sphingomonas sp. HITSZ_GF]
MRSEDVFERLLTYPPEDRAKAIRRLSGPQKREYAERWWQWAHEGQFEPKGAWRIWLIRAGRGFGKTRAGAEWVHARARANPEARIALVSGSEADVERVMIEGAGGLLAAAREDEEMLWRRSSGELIFPSGARAHVYSAGAAEGLRGPEHHFAWCDELAKWGRGGETAWDNMMLGMRLGDAPQILVTTTPRPVKLMRKVMALPGLKETQGRSAGNPWLPASFIEAMTAEYGGTRLGRQELDGEMIDDVLGALWTRALIEQCRADATPALARVVIGVDPPAGVGGDACGIVAAGLGRDGKAWVLEDASVQGATPEGWARAVAACAARHGADRVVAEKNQGGAMVKSVLLGADSALPVTLVHASQGKAARAEPVSLLYEAGKVRHLGSFPALEDELCGLVLGGGYEGPGRSPDRADALVWALTELMLRRRRRAAVRGL